VNPKLLIDFFDGTEFDFLSNFHPACITWEGKKWPSTEHAFQAAKTTDVAYAERIRRALSPGHAKSLGQRSSFMHYGVALRPDWDTVKYDIMLDLLRLKFAIPSLRKALLATGNAKLVEGNSWNDRDWGVCGEGANNLGRSLMLVRAEIRAEIAEANLEYLTGEKHGTL
jgi:hypothetical protein